MMKEFEMVPEDCDRVLGIDSDNLKVLFRKGRALVGLRQYAATCEYLEKSMKRFKLLTLLGKTSQRGQNNTASSSTLVSKNKKK